MESVSYQQITGEQFETLQAGTRIKCMDRAGRLHTVEKLGDVIYLYPDGGWTGRRVDRETVLSGYRFCLRDPEADWNARLDDVIARLKKSGLNQGVTGKLQQLRDLSYRDAEAVKCIFDDLQGERSINMHEFLRLHDQYPCLSDEQFLHLFFGYTRRGEVRPIECGADGGIDPDRVRRLVRKPKNCTLTGNGRAFVFRKNGREAMHGWFDPADGKTHWGIMLDETAVLLLFIYDPSDDPFMHDIGSQR